MVNTFPKFDLPFIDVPGSPISKEDIDSTIYPGKSTITPKKEEEKEDKLIFSPKPSPKIGTGLSDFLRLRSLPPAPSAVPTTPNVPKNLNEEIEEDSESISEEELLKDRNWIRNARTIYEDEEDKKFIGSNRELGTWFLNRHTKLGNNFYNLGKTSLKVDKMSDNVKQAWAESIGQYENSDWSMRGFLKGAQYSIIDLPTLLSFGFVGLVRAVGGKAAAALARTSFKNLVEKELKKRAGQKLGKEELKVIRKKAASDAAINSAIAGAPVGAAYSGGFDVAFQNFMGDVDPEYEYDPYRTGIATVLGTGIGAVLPYGVTKGAEKIFRESAIRKALEKDAIEVDLKFSDKFDSDTEARLANLPETNDKTAHDILREYAPTTEFTEKKGPLTFLSWGSGKYKYKAKQTDLGNNIDDGGTAQFYQDKRGMRKPAFINYNDIPEIKYLKKNLPKGSKILAYDLRNNRIKAPKGTYLDEETVLTQNPDVVFAANWMGQLELDQAAFEVGRMSKSLGPNGDLIIQLGPQKTVSGPIIKGENLGEPRKGTVRRSGERDIKIDERKIDQSAMEQREVTGVSKEQLRDLLEDKFEEVESYRLTDKGLVIDKDSDIFIAKKPYTIKTNLLPYDKKRNSKFVFKDLFRIGPKLKKVYKQNLTQSAGLPDEVRNIQRQAESAAEQIKGPIYRKVVELENLIKKNVETQDNRKWKNMTNDERNYVNLILTNIFRGRKLKFVDPENRLNTIKQGDTFSSSSPEFNKFTRDPIKRIPNNVIDKLDKMRAEIKQFQTEMENIGLIEDGSDLAASFQKSKGIGQEDPNIDLHVVRQYRIIDEGPQWVQTLKEHYPERIALAREEYKNYLDDTDLAAVSDNLKKYQSIKQARKKKQFSKSAVDLQEVNNIARSYNIDSTLDSLLRAEREAKEDSLDELVNSFLTKYAPEEESVFKNAGDFDSKNQRTLLQGLDTQNFSPSAKVRAVFYRRKEIPPAIRSLMGEYTNVADNYIHTVYKLYQNIENFKFEKQLMKLYNDSIDPVTKKSSLFPNVQFKYATPEERQAPEGFKPLIEATRLPRFTKGIKLPFLQKNRENIFAPEEIVDAIKQGNNIQPVTRDGIIGSGIRSYIGVQAYSRAAVTALRFSAYPRNWVGAGLGALGSGNFSRMGLKAANKYFMNVRNFDDPKFNAVRQKLVNLGLVGQSTRAADLRAAFQDAAGDPLKLFNSEYVLGDSKDKLSGIRGKFNRAIKGLGRQRDKLFDYYQLMDDYWKIYSYIAEKERYKVILEDDPSILGFKNVEVEVPGPPRFPGDNRPPGKEIQRVAIKPTDVKRFLQGDEYDPIKKEYKQIPVTYLDDYAAMMVRRHMDNYGEVARAFKFARRLPVADFLTYKTEQVRTTWNIFDTALTDIRRGIELQSESDGARGGARYMAGLKRLGSIIFTLGLGSSLAGATGYYYFNKMKKDKANDTIKVGTKTYAFPNTFEEAAINIAYPQYAKGFNFLPTGEPDPETGDYSVFDYTRINKWAPINETFRTVLNAFGEGEKAVSDRLSEASKATVKKIIVEELGFTMVLKAALNMIQGKDEFGRPVADPDDPAFQKALETVKAATKILVPGVLLDVENLRKVIKDYEEDKTIKNVFDNTVTVKGRGAPTAGRFEKKPDTELTKALGVPLGKVQPLVSFRYAIMPDIKKIQNSSQGFLTALKGEYRPFDRDSIIEEYKESIKRDKEGYEKLTLKFIDAKRFLTNKQITNAITSDRIFPNHYKGAIKRVNTNQGVSDKYYSTKSLDPRGQAVMNVLRDYAKSTGQSFNKVMKEYRPIQKELLQIYKSINGTQYDFIEFLKEPGKGKEDTTNRITIF